MPVIPCMEQKYPCEDGLQCGGKHYSVLVEVVMYCYHNCCW